MKRILFFLLSVIVLFQAIPVSGLAGTVTAEKTVRALVHKYRQYDGVETINIGGLLMAVARITCDGEDAEILKHIDKVTVFSAEEASQDLKSEISRDFGNLLSDRMTGFEKMMEVKDSGDEMSVFVKMSGDDAISELLMVSRSEAVIVYIVGQIPLSLLSKIVES